MHGRLTQMMQSPTLASALTLAVPSAVFTGSIVAPCGVEGSVVEIVFRIHDVHAPAFRSAVEELANELGGRVEGMHSFAQETALTDALVAVGHLKAETFRRIPKGDPHYKPRKR